jgi:hypothetical protein
VAISGKQVEKNIATGISEREFYLPGIKEAFNYCRKGFPELKCFLRVPKQKGAEHHPKNIEKKERRVMRVKAKIRELDRIAVG